MSNQNLYERFHAGDVEEAELTQILLSYFNAATQISENEIAYPAHKTDFALKLVYRKDRLAEIEAGPRLQNSIAETLERRINDELLVSPGIRVGADVLFANLPVRDAFRYRNEFQILPVPPEAPRPGFLIADHPFLIEFQFPDSTSWQIRHLRRALRGRQLELLLAGLVEGSVFSFGPMGRHYWVLLPHKEGEPMNISYCQQMYTFPGIALERDQFSSLEDTPPMESVEPTPYYTNRAISPGQELRVPTTLTQLLDRFFHSLSAEERAAFLRACFWYQHAGRVHIYSRSAAFTSLIGAVEALITPERGAPNCLYCGRSLGKGPTQLFADFIEQYALPGDGLDAERKKFYQIRSKLSHGGTLLHSDYFAWSPSLTPQRTREWSDSRAAWQLVQIALVNWLSSRP
jgi:hypothetical protein